MPTPVTRVANIRQIGAAWLPMRNAGPSDNNTRNTVVAVSTPTRCANR